MKSGSKDHAHSSTGADLWTRASHDLRQPVQALLLLMRALSLEREEQTRQDIMHRMEVSLAGLHEMLEVLALLSRLAAGRVTPVVSQCDVAEGLIRAAQSLQGLARERGADLAASPFRAMVHSDPRLLPLILNSLLLAALSSNHGSTITAAGRNRGGQVLVEVGYEGGEPTPAELGQAFIELHGTARSAAGAYGLGLGFLEYLCGMLGHRLEIAPSRNGHRKLVVVFAAAGKGASNSAA